MAGFMKTDPTEAVAIPELSRAYFSPTVSGWAPAQGDIDTEMSKAMLGQKTAAQAIKDAAREVDRDMATSPQMATAFPSVQMACKPRPG